MNVTIKIKLKQNYPLESIASNRYMSKYLNRIKTCVVHTQKI